MATLAQVPRRHQFVLPIVSGLAVNTVQMFMNTCSPFTVPCTRNRSCETVRGTSIGPRVKESIAWGPILFLRTVPCAGHRVHGTVNVEC